jgi:DNA helicase-2/ATP-dependent DNA helicase PcrA
VRISALDLARALERPLPTAEQSAVIEAAGRPSLVVAGAGSGKTETMAGRVVWLVANELVRPEQVLGLTFTRKAASELASRIRRRLGSLAARGIVDPDLIRSGEPTVSTYDAYAGRIVSDHALRLGLEPGQQLITQTMAWQYAVRVVDAYDGDMDLVTVQPATVAADVLALADGMAQHGVDPQQVRAACKELTDLLTALPRAAGQRTQNALPGELQKVVATLGARSQLLPLVELFAAEKRRREVLDFSDQMALAARLADEFDAVGSAERATFGAVLLDEYQDTSHAQLVFLRGLFAGAEGSQLITAVGDPSQAIYGWRGASQGTLEAFPRHFPGADGRPADVFTLGTSFRNASAVLAVANAVAAPLRDGLVSTPELVARPDAPSGVVACALYETVAEEAAALADRIAAIWHADRESAANAVTRDAPTCNNVAPRSIAVLVRAWKLVPRIESALRERRVPVEILGVGGLLHQPEVVDVVATLTVLADPTRGDALMRLLTGARWRIGPRDLAALGRWARRLVVTRGLAALPADSAPPESAEIDPDDVDERSIIDALDELPPAGWLSGPGDARLRRLSGELRALRARVRQPLPDLVADVVRTMGVDVEVLARSGSAPASRANLDRLVEVAADFADTVEQFNLVAFLAYLEAAVGQERALERGDDSDSTPAVPEAGHGIEVSRDRVQILTVHAAKGLEWDVVCVPGLAGDIFPGVRARDVKGWLTARGQLPWNLRGDRAGLPVADFASCTDQAAAVLSMGSFAEKTRRHLTREERRLAYVAFTRAREQLIVSGFRWDSAIKPRGDSPFLAEVRDVCGGASLAWTELPPDGAVNPLLAQGPASASWPRDPLGDRREALQAAAALVTSALSRQELVNAEQVDAEHVLPELTAAMTEWESDVTVLLRERAAREQHPRLEVVLPAHLSVSQLVTLRRDPDELAAQLRRPMPRPPAPLARRGTAFHGWLERRFGSTGLLDIDELPGSADADPVDPADPTDPTAGQAAADDLAVLQQAFLATEWADRDPVEIEVPFELSVDGLLIRGRMDAVFREPTDDRRFVVVDWKTGRRPSGDEARAAAVQLAAYRLAWADLARVDPLMVRAVFCYLRESVTVEPPGLLDRAGLAELLREVPFVAE